jgi:hypothetical protein
LLGLPFSPEVGDRSFLQNMGKFLPDSVESSQVIILFRDGSVCVVTNQDNKMNKQKMRELEK